MIHTYAPKIEVRLIKTARRMQLATGLQAASRYQDFASIDLTPLLVTGEPVTVSQQFGGAGSWSLSLVDRMMPEYGESLYAMIEQNDLVEIRMARRPHEYGSKLPVVMRGFVSSVDRSRSNMGGQLHRRVHVAGGDYSKILDIIRIYYLNNSAVGDNIVGELGFFQKYAGLENAKTMDAKHFVALVLDAVINPFIARLTVNADGQKVGAAVMHQLMPEVSIEGTVSPLSVSLFNDGSVRQFLSQFLDVGVFNEMFVDDRENESVLVVRPNRFINATGDLIQGGGLLADAETIDVLDQNIESITQGRTDAGVANYFWVSNFGWQIREAVEVSQLAATTDASQYALFDYVNCSPARYGFRKMEVTSALGAPEQSYEDAMTIEKSGAETDRLLAWLTDRRRILAEQNKDNAVLEDGQIVMAGDERVRRGVYLRTNFGTVSSMHYVTAVTHQFIPNGAFKTSVAFERGTGFLNRAQIADGQYQAERNMKGTA